MLRAQFVLMALVCFASTSTANLLCDNTSWSIIKGSWSFDPSSCSLKNTNFGDGNLIWFGSGNGQIPDANFMHDSLTLTAELALNTGAHWYPNAGVIFRASKVSTTDGAGQLYQMAINAKDKSATFKEQNGAGKPVIRGGNYAIAYNTVYKLTIVGKNNLYHVYLNDSLVYSDINETNQVNGSIGIRTYRSTATFYSLMYSPTVPATDNYTIVAMTDALSEDQVVLVVRDSLELTGDSIYSTTSTQESVTVLAAIPSERNLETDEIRRTVSEAMVEEYPELNVTIIVMKQGEHTEEESTNVVVSVMIVISIFVFFCISAGSTWFLYRKKRQKKTKIHETSIASDTTRNITDNAVVRQPGQQTEFEPGQRTQNEGKVADIAQIGESEGNLQIVKATVLQGDHRSMSDSNLLYGRKDDDDEHEIRTVGETAGATDNGGLSSHDVVKENHHVAAVSVHSSTYPGQDDIALPAASTTTGGK